VTVRASPEQSSHPLVLLLLKVGPRLDKVENNTIVTEMTRTLQRCAAVRREEGYISATTEEHAHDAYITLLSCKVERGTA